MKVATRLPSPASSCFPIASNPPLLFFGLLLCPALGLLLGFRQHPLPPGGSSHHSIFRAKLKDCPGRVREGSAFLLSFFCSSLLLKQVPPADLFLALPAGLRNFCPRLRWPFITDLFSWVFWGDHSSFPAATVGGRDNRGQRRPSGGQRRYLLPRLWREQPSGKRWPRN